MKKNTIINIGGARGVGKTTLLRSLSDSSLATDSGFVVLHMSDYLKDLSLFVYERPWSLLSEQDRQVVRVKAAERIQGLPANTILLDSHCVDMKDGQPVKIIPAEFERIIDGYIVITASPQVVRDRRLKDIRKIRDNDLTSIGTEIEYELLVATEIAYARGQRVEVMDNTFLPETSEGIEQGIMRIIEIVKKFEERGQGEYENRLHNIERC